MKINKTELLQIIKEEAGKLKKIRTLIAEREEIRKQLVEVISKEELDEMFGFSAKEQFEAGRNKFIPNWTVKGVPTPTPEELQIINTQAAQDKYQGKMGLSGDVNNLKAAKFIYKPSATINWHNQFGGGGTGGNPAGGTSGA